MTYLHRDESLYRTEGVLIIPKLASCWVYNIPRIPITSFPGWNAHQSCSQNSEVSCLHTYLHPSLLPKHLCTFQGPLKILFPFCAFMASLVLIFLFRGSWCFSDTWLLQGSPPPPTWRWHFNAHLVLAPSPLLGLCYGKSWSLVAPFIWSCLCAYVTRIISHAH